MSSINKGKIINDPVYGFVNLKPGLFYEIVEHPYFQRLRRISQLGLTQYVFSGATHNRFQHVIGAAHLMEQAINVLRHKGHHITDEEEEAVCLAILLHDIGHGPFSHTLENAIIKGITHEHLSLLFMQELNEQFGGKLSLCIQIFTNVYSKQFLHQLVSSQLDMDRLDYLQRDSFYTGVAEGVIGCDRIIKMLNVKNDQLVVDEKGIYSVENFLISRRLMYWQVYLHKAVVSAEQILILIINRARELMARGVELPITGSLKLFLNNSIVADSFKEQTATKTILELFAQLDDYDVFSAIKIWQDADDSILSLLCKRLINRNLYHLEIQAEPFKAEIINNLREKASAYFSVSMSETRYYVLSDVLTNSAYSLKNHNIKILLRSGEIMDIASASDVSNVSALTKTVKKFFLCYPKEIG